MIDTGVVPTPGMDDRIETHAEIVVDHSTDVRPGDEVLVRGPPDAEDLMIEIARLCGERGARLSSRMTSDRVDRAYKRALDPEDVDESAVSRAAAEAADVVIAIRANRNTYEGSDVPPEISSRLAQANQGVRDAVLSSRWVGTQYPTAADAQAAEMSTDAYEAFVWEAINKDWTAVRDHQQQLVEILDPAETVHITSGDETDLTMSIAGNPAINDFGEKNLPGGEVYTAPIPGSVEGTVLFDMPLMIQGREVRDVYLSFEGGEVVEYAAAKNEDVLAAVVETDDGARRLGELGIGMNREIDRFTNNMLFDEKMGDTVHLAVGRSIEESVGDGNEANESAMHVDMIVDMSENSSIAVDGAVIQRDGTFVFETDDEDGV